MFSALAVMFVLAWLFTLVGSHRFGILVHLLLIIALLLFAVDIVSQRRTTSS